jgi:hypothetical protein
MGKVGSKNFADGWQHQAKRVSEKMAESREKATAREISNTSKVMDKIKTMASLKSEGAKKSVEARLKSGVGTTQNRSQPFERARPEPQDRAARQAETIQTQEFTRNKQDAQNLKKLQSREAFTKSENTAATPKAVVQKPSADRSDMARQSVRQPVENLAEGARYTAERNAAKAKAARQLAETSKGVKGREGDKKPPQTKTTDPNRQNAEKDLKETAKIPAALNVKAAEGIKKKERPSNLGKKEGAKKDEGKKSGSLTRSEGKEASRDLGSLLGGFGGGDGSDAPLDAGEAVSASAKSGDGPGAGAVKPEKTLPEKDPGFAVFNEFDEANPGIEEVKSKAQLFARMVEKKVKLAQIARLDEKLGETLMDTMKKSFEQAPLSSRIIGELKEEFKEELSLARFLGSSYGGVRG